MRTLTTLAKYWLLTYTTKTNTHSRSEYVDDVKNTVRRGRSSSYYVLLFRCCLRWLLVRAQIQYEYMAYRAERGVAAMLMKKRSLASKVSIAAATSWFTSQQVWNKHTLRDETVFAVTDMNSTNGAPDYVVQKCRREETAVCQAIVVRWYVVRCRSLVDHESWLTADACDVTEQ